MRYRHLLSSEAECPHCEAIFTIEFDTRENSYLNPKFCPWCGEGMKYDMDEEDEEEESEVSELDFDE